MMMMQAEVEPLNMKRNTTVITAEHSFDASCFTLHHPCSSSHNHHLYSLGLHVVTFYWCNGTFTMHTGYRLWLLYIPKHCLTFATFDLRNNHSGNILGRSREFWTMNAVRHSRNEGSNIILHYCFHGTFPGTVQSEQSIREKWYLRKG
jgi:hypothetical protein